MRVTGLGGITGASRMRLEKETGETPVFSDWGKCFRRIVKEGEDHDVFWWAEGSWGQIEMKSLLDSVQRGGKREGRGLEGR